MQKRTMREVLIRLIILLIGLTIAHLGVTLFLMANMGADPYNVLVQGLYRSVSGLTGWQFLTHGRTHIALTLLIIVVLLFVDRSYIKLGTVVCTLCGGPIIDIFTALLGDLLRENDTLIGKIIMLAAGCVILAYGMTIVIKSDAGTGPNDLVSVVISDKSKRRFGVVRILVDIAFVALGALLGGSVGIGTCVCAFLVGPVAGFFLPRNEKLVQRVLRSFHIDASASA